MSWEIWKDKYAVQFPRNVRNDSYTTWTFTDVPAQLTSSRYHAIPRVTCFLWVESAQCSSKFPRQILLHVLTLSNVTRLKCIYNKIYLKKSRKTIMPFQWWNSDWIISRRSILVIPRYYQDLFHGMPCVKCRKFLNFNSDASANFTFIGI